MSGTKGMASMFEKKATDSTKVVTNAKHKKVVEWTPHNDGAHTTTGYQRQTDKTDSKGPPPKRSLNSLP